MLVLKPNIIIYFCRICRKSTFHETIVKDIFSGEYREPKCKTPIASFNGVPVKRLRKCVECGNIVKF